MNHYTEILRPSGAQRTTRALACFIGVLISRVAMSGCVRDEEPVTGQTTETPSATTPPGSTPPPTHAAGGTPPEETPPPVDPNPPGTTPPANDVAAFQDHALSETAGSGELLRRLPWRRTDTDVRRG